MTTPCATGMRGLTQVPQDPEVAEENHRRDKNENKWQRGFRRLLRLRFWGTFQWKRNHLNFHLIYCIIFVVQIVKVGLVTKQFTDFGMEREVFMEIVNNVEETIGALLLGKPDSSKEKHSDALLAVYNKDDLKQLVEGVVNRFYNCQNETLGSYRSDQDMDVSIRYWNIIDRREYNVSFTTTQPPTANGNHSRVRYYLLEELKQNNISVEVFDSIMEIKMDFNMITLRIGDDLERCFNLHGTLLFINSHLVGKTEVYLGTKTSQLSCKKYFDDELLENETEVTLSIEHIYGIVVLSGVSLVTAFFSLILGIVVFVKLRKHKANIPGYTELDRRVRTSLFRKSIFPFPDWLLRCLRPWDIVSILGDSFVIYGTVHFISLSGMSWTIRDSDKIISLGLGCGLIWVCLLQYCSLYNHFQLAAQMLYDVMWNLIVYAFVTSVVVVAYLLCGYIVIGPYHDKFRTFLSTAGCLLALACGDDIYETLTALDGTSFEWTWLWIFHRVYILSFLGLFTIIVVNVVIAIFTTIGQDVFAHMQNQRRGKLPTDRTLFADLTSFVNTREKMRDEVSVQDLKDFLKTSKEASEEEVDPIEAFIEITNNDPDCCVLFPLFQNKEARETDTGPDNVLAESSRVKVSVSWLCNCGC